MSKPHPIAWLNMPGYQGETLNPIRAMLPGELTEHGQALRGWHCEKVSAGCARCYAEAINGRFGTRQHYNAESLEVVKPFLDEGALKKPLGWKKPRAIFVGDMSDLFGEWVSDACLDKVFAVINATWVQLPIPDKVMDSQPWHRYFLLTKRPERMRAYMESRATSGFAIGQHPLFKVRGNLFRGQGGDLMNSAACIAWPPFNAWLGVSVENQAAADQRIPELLACPAAVRFLSIEPLLGPVKIPHVYRCRACGYLWTWNEATTRPDPSCPRCDQAWSCRHAIDWAIVGCESGPKRRPCKLEWVESIVSQCVSAGIPVFVKQLDIKGEVVKDFDSFPGPLRLRQFPEVRS